MTKIPTIETIAPPAELAKNVAAAGPGFAELPLSAAMLANLDRLNYTVMTPIQAASLPPALEGRDLIAQAKTGSGKTAAFAIPLLAKLDSSRFDIQALVLCPTRELADQVTQELRRLARAEDNIKILTLAGGVMMRGQRTSLEHVLTGLGMGVVGGALLGLLAWWSAGAMGPGRLALVGPNPLLVGALAAAEIGVAAALGMLAGRVRLPSVRAAKR